MGRLDGKVAIVAGGGSSGPPGERIGSGKAISLLFAREGAKVVVLDRVERAAKETQDMIVKEGGQASIFTGDITKAKDCEAVTEAAVQRYGGLHILVNNIGAARQGDLMHLTEEDYDRTFAVILKGTALMTRYAVPKMVQSGGGSIINIGSIGALHPPEGHFAYITAKGGVLSLTIATAVEQGHNGIRANCIMPGRFVTQADPSRHPTPSGRYSKLSQEQWNAREKLNLLGATINAWDMANAAVFLASDESRCITAVGLPVDAGLHANVPDLQSLRALG